MTVRVRSELASRKHFKVVGYTASWRAAPSEGQIRCLTHLHYAFLNPNEGITAANVPRPSRLKQLVHVAHAHDVRVLLAVGGWTGRDNSAFEHYASTASGRARFADAMVRLVDGFELDGIDIDWEWPQAGGTDALYLGLVERLAEALHASGKLCTTAVIGGDVSGVPVETFGVVDFVSVMAYDHAGEDGHSSRAHAASALASWSAHGLPRQKAILGVPFYGRGARERSFREIVSVDIEAPSKDESDGVHYNGQATIRDKVRLAARSAAGVMVWELSQDLDADDVRSLLHSLDEEVRLQTTTASG